MGLSGLEPPTSRLSGVRSNQLSYKPGLDKERKMPGSHLLSRSLAPQYHRPAVSLPSCSGWERVFLTAALPPDKFFSYLLLLFF